MTRSAGRILAALLFAVGALQCGGEPMAPDEPISTVAGALSEEDGDIDVDRIPREQQAMDTAGHYNRPDIFTVRIDRSPRAPVTWIEGGASA